MKRKTNSTLLIYLSGISVLILCALPVRAQVPVPAAYPPGAKINYVRTWDMIAPGVDSIATGSKPVTVVKQTTAYTDGLGRVLQTVAKQAAQQSSGALVDLVSTHVYDGFGREQYRYLPFAANTAGGNVSVNDGSFKLNPFAQQAAFMQEQYSPQGETFFYGQTVYESSPSGRPVKTMAPGNSWAGAGRGISVDYNINRTGDSVRIWSIVNNAGTFGSISTAATYAAGELYKTITTDEQGKQVIEFTDKQGRVILKKVQLTAAADSSINRSGHNGWLCTYYVYDDFNRLRVVIPPKAVEELQKPEVGWIPSTTLLDEGCFRYAYDQRGRMVMKKIPGAATVELVYDQRDRLVLTRDGNLTAQGKWLYTRYDELNRAVATGLWNNTAGRQSHATAAYSSTSYPDLAGQTTEELTTTYYDNYNWLSTNGNPFPSTRSTADDSQFSAADGNTYPYPRALQQSNATRGMVTGSRVKVLSSSNQYLYSISYYDDRGRVIQAQSQNSSGGTDVVTTQYGFAGQVLRTAQRHQKAGVNAQTVVLVTTSDYDVLGRIIAVKKKIVHTTGGQTNIIPEKTIAQLTYDATGQLKTTILGNTLETLTYDYNIRGWLLGANRDYARDIDNNHWFGFDLGYDKAANNLIGNQTYAAPQYNGNISGTVWKARGDGEKRKYDFTYDAASRLLGAEFTQYSGSSFNKTAGTDFSMKMGDGTNPNSAYDAGGNILAMTQKGLKLNTSVTIDSLQYSYFTASNKLQQVLDGANDKTSVLGDFKYDPATKTTTDYSYDANGNMTGDRNKNISSITCNHLNLPQVITVDGKGTIEYVYDAAGNRLRKIVHETGKPDITTEYINGFVYENDILQQVGHEEGRIRYARQYYLNGDSAMVWQYDYFLKDHLGNVRTVLTEQTDTARYVATFETGYREREMALFTKIPETAYRVADILDPLYPPDETTDPNAYVSKLAYNGNRLGATVALKVMAGDKVDIATRAWVPYAASAPDEQPIESVSLFNSLLNALTNGAAGLSGGHTTPGVLQGTGSSMPPGITSFLSSHNDVVLPSPPKAYLNWILFDEQFKYVPEGSGFIRVGYYDDGRLQTLAQSGLPVIKNGYLFVYLSNESKKPVFFDNLMVQHYTGPLVEETQYYPFGLVQQGISAKAFGRLDNKNKYNGYEQNKTFDINLNESFYRLHDPQLGRFWQIDPKPNEFESPYAAMGNNPVLHNDILGDTSVKAAGGNHDVDIDANANALEFYQSSTSYKTTDGTTAVPVQPGQLRSFTNVLGRFSARWSTGADGTAVFAGYQNDYGLTVEGAIARLNEISSSWGYKLYSFGERLRYETESDPVGFNLKVTLTLLTMSAMNAAEPVGYSPGYNPSVVTKESFSGLGTLRFTAATVAKGGVEVLEGVVKSNYARFVSKIPANSKASSSFQLLDDGNYLFQATSPGKVPGSSALYQKWVSSQGETFKMIKTTFAPDGNIIHVKSKF